MIGVSEEYKFIIKRKKCCKFNHLINSLSGVDKTFINKIQQIILKHLDNEKLSVENLAFEIGLSRSQLLRKVKASTGKTVSEFIKEIRLNEALKLLKESDYTASEISYRVGFSSPAYFNKCFHDNFGVTPGDFKAKSEKSYLFKKNDESGNLESKSSISKIDKTNKIQKKSFKRKKFIVSSLLVLLIIVLSFYFYTDFTNKTTLFKIKTANKTIAVLPFKDMSSEETQWFCDGVTDNILSKLSQINGLTVISRTSSDTYKNTVKKIPQIAKELGVSYIIEGSVTKYNNEVKIITQLINAYGEHIWSKEYTDSFDDIFIIQQNVAKQIAEQLQINLTLDEGKRIDYIPTDNLESYKLFLYGCSVAENRTKEGLITSIKLFQKAIDLDSNYAEAYAEIAASYRLLMYKYNFGNEITYEEIDSLLDRSLEINPKTVRAYTTKGMISITQENWLKAKENYEKALELNPNDATTHHYYAIYHSMKPEADYKKALEHINIAQILNPYFSSINATRIYFLLKNDKIIEAEEFYNHSNSFFTSKTKSIMQNDIITYKAKKKCTEKKDWKEIIKIYHRTIEKDSLNVEIYRRLAEAYKEILIDAENYLKYADKAYKLDSIGWKNAISYFNSLIKNKNFDAAKKLLQSKNFKSIFNEELEFKYLFYWYYHQGDYKKAMESLGKYKYENHFEFAINLAQQNKVMETYQILNNDVLKKFEKAIVFAILKERDSMYYYIDKEKDIFYIQEFNAFNEVDPYRKEERYKAFLKNNYLPITHWNE